MQSAHLHHKQVVQVQLLVAIPPRTSSENICDPTAAAAAAAGVCACVCVSDISRSELLNATHLFRETHVFLFFFL